MIVVDDVEMQRSTTCERIFALFSHSTSQHDDESVEGFVFVFRCPQKQPPGDAASGEATSSPRFISSSEITTGAYLESDNNKKKHTINEVD